MKKPPPKYLLGRVMELASSLPLAQDAAERSRARTIGIQISQLKDRPTAQALAWLERVRDTDGISDKTVAAFDLAQLLLALVGFLLGFATGLAVFWYDGTHPINAITVLGTLVFFPLLLLALTLFAALPFRFTHRVPGFRQLQSALLALSPGHLQRVAIKALPRRLASPLDTFFSAAAKSGSLYGPVQRWLVLLAGQIFAVFFFGGAIAAALCLVIFSDLAFGWSTTLDLNPKTLHHATQVLAAPWDSLYPAAQPSLDLITETRFYRLESARAQVLHPSAFSRWWPFLILSIFLYSLLPRVILLFCCRIGLTNALWQTIPQLPGVGDLLWAMNYEDLQSRAQQHALDLDGTAELDYAELLPLPAVSFIVAWGDVEVPQELLSNGEELARVGPGEALTAEEDILQRAGSRIIEVAVLVKGWEPPTAELVDFLRLFRSRLQGNGRIFIVPLWSHGQHQLLSDDRQLQVWQRSLSRLSDPSFVMAKLEGR